MSTETKEELERAFVLEKFRAGWSKGMIKEELRRKFGPQPNNMIERYIRLAKEALAVATVSDPDMAYALDLYRRWTSIGNLVFAQLTCRERFHRSLKIPPPAEMAGLTRDWGKSALPPREAVQQIAAELADLLQTIQTKNPH